jgi:hypothetical protein
MRTRVGKRDDDGRAVQARHLASPNVRLRDPRISAISAAQAMNVEHRDTEQHARYIEQRKTK